MKGFRLYNDYFGILLKDSHNINQNFFDLHEEHKNNMLLWNMIVQCSSETQKDRNSENGNKWTSDSGNQEDAIIFEILKYQT